MYKPTVELPEQLQRSLYRLVALVELFDAEVTRAMEVIRDLPGYKVQDLLSEAEQYFLLFVPAPAFDKALSLQILEIISDILPADEGEYRALLAEFVDQRGSDLQALYDEYGPRSGGEEFRYVLLSQPESIVIFERLVNDPDRLVDAWRQADLPENLIQAMAAVMAVPLD